MTSTQPTPAEAIRSGQTALGIELGSTRIKAVLVSTATGRPVLASGSHTWVSVCVDGTWTYPLDEVWTGLQGAYAALAADVERRYGLPLTTTGALGISAMMHGYLALDEAGELLVPFRTWRNTGTGAATAILRPALGVNIPHRWSVAHHFQAVLDHEEHLGRLARLTTLAGLVHHRLTGQWVLGVGDASGMFPVRDGDYDAELLDRYDALVAAQTAPSASEPGSASTGLRPLRDLLPRVLTAGQDAGRLTPEGASLLDPTGLLRPGVPLCPPEGDAGTGMVATNAITPRTGNVSAGTSIFAIVVLEGPLAAAHPEIDVVTTPVGDPVAMVHCNNGAAEIDAWAGVFAEFARAVGAQVDMAMVFTALLTATAQAAPDAGGVTAYNYLAGEPITGVEQGRPLVLRTPGSNLTLANVVRAQLYAAFATLRLGMDVLAREGVRIDELLAHGGLFSTPGVAQSALAAALRVPVCVGASAAEGGPWGMAVLADYAVHGEGVDLSTYLAREVFADAEFTRTAPDPVQVAGYEEYLARFVAGLPVVRAAAESPLEA